MTHISLDIALAASYRILSFSSLNFSILNLCHRCWKIWEIKNKTGSERHHLSIVLFLELTERVPQFNPAIQYINEQQPKYTVDGV